MTRKSVYLAGPEVFLPNAISVLLEKAALCLVYGFEVRLPGDDHVQQRAAMQSTLTSAEIYAANIGMMTAADFGIFDLTPFRGPSADVGTAFELGLMTGMGKPVFGYTNVISDYIDRIYLKQSVPSTAPTNTWRDENGWSIENFGNTDNLMLTETLNRRDQRLVRDEAALPNRLQVLTGFKACLEQAKLYFTASLNSQP